MAIVRKTSITLSVTDNTCSITPNCRRTIATLDDTESNITFIVDNSRSQPGDELIFITHSIAPRQLYFYPDNGFVLTSCRTANTPNNEEESYFTPPPEWVGKFTFDGDKFVNTYEIC